MSALAVLEELHRADAAADSVSLRGCEIEALDEPALAFLETRFPRLRHLDLRGNRLTALPPRLGAAVPSLAALDLRENAFASIPALSEALAACVALQSLHVTLRNRTDERVLRVMLPGLRELNGAALDGGGDEDAEKTRPPPLALDLAVSPTSSSSGSLDLSASPCVRWLDTPPSAACSAVRPVRSPQDKRELRLHLAAAKQRAKSPPTKSRGQSVRPTELPAAISDEHTDWRKLLKQTAATSESGCGFKQQQQQQPAKGTLASQHAAATSDGAGLTTTTRVFIAELKAIVRSFQRQQPPAAGRGGGGEEDRALLDQLDRKIDQLALQLTDLEKAPPATTAGNDAAASGLVVTASLAARWRLVEAGTLYAAHKAAGVDRSLGTGLHKLMQTQTQVVEALLHHVNDTICAQHKWQHASAGQAQVAEQQKQQMKLLLDVAETLERDLEALQAKYEREKADREQAQAASEALRAACSEMKSQLNDGKKEERKAAAKAGAQRRIRKRSEQGGGGTVALTEAAPRPASPPTAVATKSKTASSPPPPPTVKPRPPSPAKPAPAPTVLRSLTLKQLVDLLHCILASKAKYDARARAVGAPPETVEQHMYTYLTQRFGLPSLTVEYAAAIWKACVAYARQDNDVAMFHALLRNHVDEDFVGIKLKLQHALRELLRAYFVARHPLKPEPAAHKWVDAKFRGSGAINEHEWTELLLYLYDPSDSSILMRLVKRQAEGMQTQQPPPPQQQPHRQATASEAATLSLPFAVFEKLLYDYQLQGRLRLLESFRELWSELDSERVGVLSRGAFRELVRQVAPRRGDAEVRRMLERVDPFEHDTVMFSDAVRCLLQDIRQHSVSRRGMLVAKQQQQQQQDTQQPQHGRSNLRR